MKKLPYSNVLKVLAFLTQEIMIGIVLIAFFILVRGNLDQPYYEEIAQNKSYLESGYFKDQFRQDIEQAGYLAECKSRLEENGKLNLEKAVKISDFFEDTSGLSEYSKSIEYRLGDLVSWVTEYTVEYTDLSEGIQNYYNNQVHGTQVLYWDSESSLNNENAAAQGEKLPKSTNEKYQEEMLWMLDEYGAEINMDGERRQIIKERFTSLGGVRILDVERESEQVETISREIETALFALKGQYEFYTQYAGKYNQSEAGGILIYIADTAGNKVWLNNAVEAQEDYTKSFNYNAGLFPMAVYNSDSGEFILEEGKSLGLYNSIYGIMSGLSFPGRQSYVFAAALNLDEEGYQNTYTKAQGIYNQTRTCLLLIAAGLAAVFLLFLYQCFVCGRKYGSEEVYLNTFDEILTEIGAAMIIIPAFLILLILDGFSPDSIFGQEEVLVSLLIIAESALFTIGMLSLLKRMKARQVWKNSILYTVLRLLGQFWIYRKETVKTGMLFGGYAVLSLVMLFLAFTSRSGFLWLLAWGAGTAVLGVFLLKEAADKQKVMDGIMQITKGDLDYKINTETIRGNNKALAESVNHIGEGLHNAVADSMRNERLKTDLITNVSHDIKTPLTSIINYVDLLKREHIENEKVQGYIEVLDTKSQRLKHLTEDLVEASKISSGNITLEMVKLNFVELINQTDGEFEEKFGSRSLEVIKTLPEEPVIIYADSRRIWRVIENLYNNIYKYAMPGTRVYVDLVVDEDKTRLSVKNISEHQLNISADELTERFIRGDVSRSTEGSGLGLSIAKNLTELQNGRFTIYLDGDLFRVTIEFPCVLKEQDVPSPKVDQEA